MSKLLHRQLALLLLLAASAYGQITHVYPALDTNNSFTGIDYFTQLVPPYGTYAQMQAWVSPPPQMVWFMTDATSVGVCTQGGGTYQAWCGYWNGHWVNLGGGGGGGGGDTITSPHNTIVVGGTTTNTTVDVVGAAGEILAGSTPALTYTPTLGVPNSHAGTLTLADGSANASTTIETAATSNWTLNLPTTAGTANYVLQTDGSGNTSWVANGGGAILCSQMPALTGAVTTSAGSCSTAGVSTRECEIVWGGSGAAFALTSGDDAIANQSCLNDLGSTETITSVKCRSDAGSNTTTITPTFGSAGTGTSICSGALTCGSSGAYGSSCTVSNASLTAGSNINPVMGGTLTGTSIHVLVKYTVPVL